MIDLPKGVDLESLLLFLRKLGIDASTILRKYDDNSLSLYNPVADLKNFEDKNGPVTNADLEINQLILNRFLEIYSNINWEIITEENSKDNKLSKTKSNWIWLIDPLDGTKDFIQKTGEYAVHFALNYKNSPVLGMVVLPSLKEIWFGVKDLGTWREIEQKPLEDKEFKFFSKPKLKTIVTSKNHINEKLEKILKELNIKEVKRMGSIGFKVCSLLRNEAEIYISISDKTAPKDWDVAAPHVLLENAKCNFTYVSSCNLSYNNKNYEQIGCLIASTLEEKEHFNICKRVKNIIKKYNL